VQRLLLAMAELCLRRPALVVTISALGCILLGLGSFVVPVDVSFQSLMDPEEPLIARYNVMTARLNLVGRLPLLLEGDEEKLDPALAELTRVLEATPFVSRVVGAPPRQWLEENGPWLVDRKTFDDWLGLATRPEDRTSAERLIERLEALAAERGLEPRQGMRLVLVQMAWDPLFKPMGDNGFREVEAATREVLAPLGVVGSYTGVAAAGQHDQEQVLKRVQILTPLSLLIVLILLSRFEPRPLHLGAVAVPMMLAAFATLGAVGFVAGEIILIESFFGVLIFGLGVDFALHLMVRTREEMERGRSYPEALRAAISGTGAGVVAGGLTTAGAFLVIAAAPGPIPTHLGLSGGIGLLLCLLLMVSVLPALWTLLGKRPPKKQRRSLAAPVIAALAAHSARRPWLALGAGLLIVVAALAGLPRYRWVTDLREVFTRDAPAMVTMERIQELYGRNPAPWVVVAKDVDDARRIAEGFSSHPLFGRVESAADLIPSAAAERQRQLDAAAEEIAAQREAYRVLGLLGDEEQAEQLEGLGKLLAALETARTAGPPQLDTLPEQVRAQLLTPEGEPIVFAYVREPGIDGAQAREERLAAEAVDPGAASAALVYESLLLGEHPYLKWVFVGILVYVALVLGLDLRRPRLILMALTPVLFGTVVSFGLMCWAGLRFNVMTTITVPLIIGLGVDDGIHLVHRLREEPGLPVQQAAASVGRAIVLTTLTTCASVSTLLYANHPGLESMALMLIVGLPLCLLATVVLVPALGVVLGVAHVDDRRPSVVHVESSHRAQKRMRLKG